MIAIGLLIGFYIYILLFLGFTGVFYKSSIIAITAIYIIIAGIILKKKQIKLWKGSWEEIKRNIHKNKLIAFLATLICIQMGINFIGVLAPETAFDSLWYHLTLAKIYIIHHKIIHIPGGLLYYSDMPKLIEILYAAVLNFGNEIVAKGINYIFSTLTLLTTYTISAKYINKKTGIIAASLLIANIVFSWESTTAYIDIGRSFFEIFSLGCFLIWTEKKQTKWLVTTAILLGFAITIKILAISSLIIFLIISIALQLQEREKNQLLKNCVIISASLLIPLPWFIFSFIHTGNPVFPFFTHTYQIKPAIQSPNPFKILIDFWNMVMYSSDPISPIYIIVLPILPFIFKNMNKSINIINSYSLIAIVIWLATPRTGGGRFILPYLPALSITAAAIIEYMKKQRFIYKTLILVICVISIGTIFYRSIAEKKYIPVVIGQETKATFLTNNLNFGFGDFYDTDSYFAKHIKNTDVVLLYGFHNLYYADFPFIDSSWVKKGDMFNYIATQNTNLPKKYTNWKQIYENKRTHVKLYTMNKKLWTY